MNQFILRLIKLYKNYQIIFSSAKANSTGTQLFAPIALISLLSPLPALALNLDSFKNSVVRGTHFLTGAQNNRDLWKSQCKVTTSEPAKGKGKRQHNEVTEWKMIDEIAGCMYEIKLKSKTNGTNQNSLPVNAPITAELSAFDEYLTSDSGTELSLSSPSETLAQVEKYYVRFFSMQAEIPPHIPGQTETFPIHFHVNSVFNCPIVGGYGWSDSYTYFVIADVTRDDKGYHVEKMAYNRDVDCPGLANKAGFLLPAAVTLEQHLWLNHRNPNKNQIENVDALDFP